MWILGISKSHNGSVALIHDGKIISAIQAERISRIKRYPIDLKNDKILIKKCIDYCLKEAGISHTELNSVAISTPWDVNCSEDNLLFDHIGITPKNYRKTYYVPHHYAHVEYIIHYHNLSPGIVLIIDGSGSKEDDRKNFNIKENISSKYISHVNKSGKETISAYWFDGKNIFLIYRFSPSLDIFDKSNEKSKGFLQSIGHYWRWASNYCCGSHTEAGKVMGLAAYGDPNIYKNLKILSIKGDGSIKVDYKMLDKKFNKPNIFSKDLTNDSHYSNIAAMVQKDTEDILFKILKFLKKKHSSNTLYYAGGVALNMVANEKIIKSKLFNNVVLNGSVEDNGTAIGAALAASYELQNKRSPEKITDYYGKSYSNEEILNAINKFKFKYEFISEQKKYDIVAKLIYNNNVVGWFQGRSEFGPRALGNRSILANPTHSKMKYILDLYIKQRDRYRPYAPVVLEEYSKKYFDIDGTSPVMMSGGKVLSKKFKAITHVDGSARIQTLSKSDNIIFYNLIKSFQKISGFPIILNTSFNLPGEPIVETPVDALNSFRNGSLPYLCLGNYLVSREER